MAGDELWCRVAMIGADGDAIATWTIRGVGTPTLAVVDGLSRLHVAAAQCGGGLRLEDVCHDLEDLIDLVGLRECLRPEAVAEGRRPGRPGRRPGSS